MELDHLRRLLLGPWNVRSEELKDSSFSIALKELRKARETHLAKGKDVKLRCFFLEKDPAAYDRLKQFADQIHDAEIETRNDELEASINSILAFVKRGGRETFRSFSLTQPAGPASHYGALRRY